MTVTAPSVQLRTSCGLDLAPDSARWFCEPDDDDLVAIEGLEGPVLDVGCGPGRIVAHLVSNGTTALGVDVSAIAVEHTRERGAPALQRSVFDPLPGTGRWGAAVLLDGNIGIGGDPVALLARLAELVRPSGVVVAEVTPPGGDTRTVRARISNGLEATDWFPWALVSADGIGPLVRLAGMRLRSIVSSNDRWFATVEHA